MKGRRLPLGGASRRGAGEHGENNKSAAAANNKPKAPPSSSSPVAAEGPATSRPQRSISPKSSNLSPSESGGSGTNKTNRPSRGLPLSSKSPPSQSSASDAAADNGIKVPDSAVAEGSSSSGKAVGDPVASAAASADAGVVDIKNIPLELERAIPRKRTSEVSDMSSSRMKCYEVLPTLDAVNRDGSHSTVKLTIGGHHYAPVRDTEDYHIHHSSAVGQDGNKFYCQVCKGFGEIVCCDGCPRVYHPHCIPADNPSRLSLEQDDDPWYCPKCIAGTTPAGGGNKKKKKKSKKNSSRLRSTSQHRCVDCQMNRTDLALEPCEDCGNYVHYPHCRDDTLASSTSVFCSTCHAVDELTMEEDCLIGTAESKKKKRKKAPGEGGEEGEDYDEDDEDMATASTPTDGDGATTPRKKRKKSRDPNGSDKKQKKKKKSNKKQRKSRESGAAARSPSPDRDTSPLPPVPPQEEASPFQARNAAGMAQATPAFYFYLCENRWKIERSLARNHRYFNRLPKGSERNALVASEAAIWWAKLRPADHRRYINMSMREFESRIIEWKEEKTMQHFGLAEVPAAGAAAAASSSLPTMAEDSVKYDDSAEDDKLTYDLHERLYLNTSVGSKPFNPEPDQSYNRVLLDLLHDMRFHPLPMFSINRPDTETVIDDHNAKVTIPHFEVHGPISTSVGDECFGCSRGWLHFCPVLQRRVPAIEHRSKLQPPLSSWVATRVGLGLRPRLDKAHEGGKNGSKPHDLFNWRSSEEMAETNNLPVVPSSSLSHPSDRADDIANFIEETMAMKVPEPPRPSPPAAKSAPVSTGRKLPTQRLVKEANAKEGQEGSVYKCGRCRTIIYNDTGCVQCRRAQLVINTTKRAPSNPEKTGNLNVRTVMLGRVQTKDGQNETQSESDLAVSNAILKERWSPSAILPPHGSDVPRATTHSAEQDDEEEDEVMDPMEIDDVEKTSGVEEKDGAAEVVSGDQTEQDSKVPSRRPQRSSRMSPGTTATGELPPLDRDHIAKENKKKSDELYRKTLSIACCGILLAMKRRDPLLLFAEPATAEGYSAVVKSPIDLGKIRANVLAEKYSSLGAFVADARLLCENALVFNPAGSIYSKTAKELYELLTDMQKRAHNWMCAIIDTYSRFLFNEEQHNRKAASEGQTADNSSSEPADPLDSLRKEWPQAVDMLENGEWLKKQLESDFMRTHENEAVYYGNIAVRRVAAAAEASFAPYTDSGGAHSVVSKRTAEQDEALRQLIDEKVSALLLPLQLKDISGWREESVVRLLRKVQSRRLDRRSASENGCSKCDSLESVHGNMKASNVEFAHPGRTKRKGEGDVPRADSSRVYLTTGLGSAKTCKKIVQRAKQNQDEAMDTLDEVCVSVRGSKIHGWGMFADQPFKKGDVVSEYVGEYVANSVADAREKLYQEQRIQDYQFRLDDKLVIDATMKGGYGRYINHNCSPNCYAKIVPGKEPKPHLKRVLIIAQRSIEINEEISYDYQFPLELNLANRIPCNCQSDACRGFMNWDIPEKGSNNRALLVQKRGANMRDRIRRLGRPLKRDEV